MKRSKLAHRWTVLLPIVWLGVGAACGGSGSPRSTGGDAGAADAAQEAGTSDARTHDARSSESGPDVATDSASDGSRGADGGACAGDGFAGAPLGAPQYPHMLDGYKTRSPCKVAGVDYRVGIHTGKTLSPPTTLTSNPAITVASGTVRCVGATSVTFDSIDFTGYSIYNGSDGCQNVTITNSKFACPNAWSTMAPFAFINDQLPARWVIRYDEFYGDDCGTWPNDLSDPISLDKVVFQYNLMRHMPERHVSVGGDGEVDYRYDLIDQDVTQPGAHENFLQFGGGKMGDVVVAFNTTYSKDDPSGAEGFQFYTNSAGSFGSIAFTNNTMIALGSASKPSMTYMVHGDCHAESDCSTTIAPIAMGGTNADNYFDPSGAFGVYYGGSFDLPGAKWSSRHNVNMVTGAPVPP